MSDLPGLRTVSDSGILCGLMKTVDLFHRFIFVETLKYVNKHTGDVTQRCYERFSLRRQHRFSQTAWLQPQKGERLQTCIYECSWAVACIYRVGVWQGSL